MYIIYNYSFRMCISEIAKRHASRRHVFVLRIRDS